MLIVFVILWQLQVIAQTPSIYVSSHADGDIIRISETATFADISISIGLDIRLEDIKVGITNNRNEADFVVTGKKEKADISYKVDNTENFPELVIHYGGENMFGIPDYRIQLVENNYFADILIYSEKLTLSEQEVIACLLPMIRKKTGK